MGRPHHPSSRARRARAPRGAGVERRTLAPLGRDGPRPAGGGGGRDAILPPGVVDDLVDRSGGNPLFLQELVNATVSGSLTDVPETIEALVTATIDTLPVRDRSLLRQASILGSLVPLGTLAAMVDEPLERVTLAARRLGHFLVEQPDGTVRFRHILLRDVAYDGLSFRARRQMHDRAGEILEQRPRSRTPWPSCCRSTSTAPDASRESWQYSCLAGERAQRNGASVEAAAFYERALDAAAASTR